MPPALPIDAHLDAIVSAVRRRRAAVVTAPPGAGKTTRVPPALAAAFGPVIVLQPRRVAARTIARRIAEEQAWTIGREAGWHVRLDRRASADTRVLVATEGILTARLQQDPRLTGVNVIVLDEFHERSIHADLGLALARRAWRARPDLAVVVMSATMDATRVAAYLDDCPLIEVPGRMFPIEVIYRPGLEVAAAVADALPGATGALLCFLPGAGEIRRAAERLAADRRLQGVPVLPLHGGLDADEQDAALVPGAGRRVILATNLAETTVTVPDVVCVVDAGLQKVARYDAERAIDSLETERVSLDAAEQRAGRAGRTQPGAAVRLWDARDRLRPHREPEIARVDLASVALSVIAAGGDPRTLEWLEAPPAAALERAMALLGRLGAIERDQGARVTDLGRVLARLPLHPRLARILVEARGAPEAARACALLSERHFVPARTRTTSCDLLAAVEREVSLPPHVPAAARQIRDVCRAALGSVADRIEDAAFRRAVLSGYPDRVARRRRHGRIGWCLRPGRGRGSRARAACTTRSSWSPSMSPRGGQARDRKRSCGWRQASSATGWRRRPRRPGTSCGHDGSVRAVRVELYDALVMSEHPVAVDPAEAARLIGDAYVGREPSDEDRALRARASFAGVDLDWPALVRRAAAGARRLEDVTPASALPAETRRALDRAAPPRWPLPSGRSAALVYQDDGRVVLRVKLQELFGVTDTPRVGPRQTPITIELLAPNGRPVQVTSDLASFWERVYPTIRPALRARYPKHRW